jgi:hypothetical protein
MDIMKIHTPNLLQIENMNSLVSALARTNFLIYGEIHGIKENADLVYTLARNLNIKRIAIENDPSVKGFINAAARGEWDFTLIDTDTFDTSILSLEMVCTIASLLKEGHIKEVTYIDTFFTSDDNWEDDDPSSPQKREQDLADNILALDADTPTLCLMGQWHTQPQPVQTPNGEHRSALYRCRLIKPNISFVHLIYRQGEAYNDGRTLALPMRSDLPTHYTVQQIRDTDFDLIVPHAHPISLPTNAR